MLTICQHQTKFWKPRDVLKSDPVFRLETRCLVDQDIQSQLHTHMQKCNFDKSSKGQVHRAMGTCERGVWSKHVSKSFFPKEMLCKAAVNRMRKR